MEQMTPFTYGGFHDVPRCISIRHRGIHFVLQCSFDEVTDEYPDTYTVWIVPDQSGDAHPCSVELSGPRDRLVGEIPVREVKFDDRKREELDASILDPFVDLGWRAIHRSS